MVFPNRTLPLWALGALCCASAWSQSAISVGELEVDPPTLAAIGLSVQIAAGDSEYNAQARVEYRPAGTDQWRRAMDLMRVRPDRSRTPTRPPEFAGSIIGLSPGTTYDIRVSVTDPDGGNATRTVTTSTRPVPPSEPTTARPIRVTTTTELTAALAAAAPGDVISISPGTYTGNFSIKRSGTESDPIFLRGENRDTSVLMSESGTGLLISADYITIENLTIRGTGIDRQDTGTTDRAVSVSGHRGITVRNNRIVGKDIGYIAWRVTNRDHTIYNNLFAGNDPWLQIDNGNATWNDEGIAVSGQGHAVFNNTLWGYGDALGLKDPSSALAPNNNISIDFYRNEVIWTCDDGLELDESYRNVRAWENRILNSNHGVSKQSNGTDHGGPVYFVRNVLLNAKNSPIKLNDGTSGVYFLHNTMVRSAQWGYISYNGGQHDNYRAINNIVVNTRAGGRMLGHESFVDLTNSELSHFGFYPDNVYWFHKQVSIDGTTLAQILSQGTTVLAGSRVLTQPIFASEIRTGFDHTTMIDPAKQNVDVTLSASSNAVDAAKVIPGLNDGHLGAGPDLGALERGKPLPSYGADFSPYATFRRPRPPGSLVAH
jgi:hypothetical protein